MVKSAIFVKHKPFPVPSPDLNRPLQSHFGGASD